MSSINLIKQARHFQADPNSQVNSMEQKLRFLESMPKHANLAYFAASDAQKFRRLFWNIQADAVEVFKGNPEDVSNTDIVGAKAIIIVVDEILAGVASMGVAWYGAQALYHTALAATIE